MTFLLLWFIEFVSNLIITIYALLKKALWKINSTIFGEAVTAKSPPPGIIFREGWLNVNGLPSHVLTWGGWIEDPLPEGEYLLVFMCGVPGIANFYRHFLELLHIKSGIPVWTIGIAGHEIPPPSTNLNLPKDSNKYNNVKAQIAHKKAFFKEYVPKNRKVYFIGHSFGSKMVLELLKDNQAEMQAEKSILLMPTIERFRETERAQLWLFLLKYGVVHLIILCTGILWLMPMSWRLRLALLYFRSRGLYNTHQCLLEAMLQLWNPFIMYNVRDLVLDELDEIVDLDIELLKSQKDKMKVYFAPNDYWAPLSHYESLNKAVPELQIEVLDDKYIHAFSLATAQDMAELLVKELKTADVINTQDKTATDHDINTMTSRVMELNTINTKSNTKMTIDDDTTNLIQDKDEFIVAALIDSES